MYGNRPDGPTNVRDGLAWYGPGGGRRGCWRKRVCSIRERERDCYARASTGINGSRRNPGVCSRESRYEQWNIELFKRRHDPISKKFAPPNRRTEQIGVNDRFRSAICTGGMFVGKNTWSMSLMGHRWNNATKHIKIDIDFDFFYNFVVEYDSMSKRPNYTKMTFRTIRNTLNILTNITFDYRYR